MEANGDEHEVVTPEDAEESDAGESKEASESEKSESDDSSDNDDDMLEEIKEGSVCNHDLLGKVTVLKLRGDQSWQEHKALVKLHPKRKKPGAQGAVERWVFKDCLTLIREDVELPRQDAPKWPIYDNGVNSVELTTEEVMELRAQAGGENELEPLPMEVARAYIERKRKTKRLGEAPRRGRRPKMGDRMTKEPKVDPAQRVAEFGGQSFRVSNGALFCSACTSVVSLRKCTIRWHINSQSHRSSLDKFNSRMQNSQQTITLLEKARNEAPDERGGCVDKHVQEFRFATVETMMGCGIPLNKLDVGLGTLLTRSGMRVTNASDMSQYIPLVLQKELNVLKDELAEQSLCIIFDGTTRVGEVLAVVVRYCTQDFRIVQRLIALRTAAKHMNGLALAGMLIRILVQRIGPTALDTTIAASRDSCSTNGAALRSVKLSALPNLLDICCICHTLHNCAKHLELAKLESFLTPWLKLMSHSHRAKLMWKELIGEPPVLFSQVRWWSRMECAMQLAKNFNFLDEFVSKLENEDIGDASTKALRAVLTGHKTPFTCFKLSWQWCSIVQSSVRRLTASKEIDWNFSLFKRT